MDNNNYTTSKYLEDFISVLTFNEYAEERNIRVEEKILFEYLENITNQYKNTDSEKFKNLYEYLLLNKGFIKKNIKYDYQRKIILEKLLNDNLKKFKDNGSEMLNIYNIEINYFSFNSNKKIKEIKETIDFKNINKTKEILDKKLIDYIYYKKEINNFEYLDKKIKNEILKNNDYFIIDEEGIFLIGKIKRSIKENINLKYTFFKIITKENIGINTIKCEKINYLNNLENIKITKFKNIEIHKLNKIIINNLKFINDIFKINNNNEFIYIILCDLEYDREISTQLILNKKIKNEVKNIEEEFLLHKKVDYNFKLYE